MNYNEYAEAVEVLNQWAAAYAAGDPIVEDDIYDKKYLELKKFEMEHPSFILDNSPTRHIIDGAEGFRKVEHKIPMVSIANSNGIEEATEWVNMMADTYGVKEFMLEYKLDGGGLALQYRNGTMVDAVTRGKDNIGDSIWENALNIGGALHTIEQPNQSEDFEVRGEVLWDFEDFDEYNDILSEQGKKLLSNPRNGATGTMKLHDPKEVANRKIHFVAYHIVSGVQTKTQEEDLLVLEKLGFAVPPHRLVTVENFVEVAEDMRAKRYDMPYPIDGIVIKVNDKSIQKEIGYTVKSPNFFRAYKFPPEERDTELLGLELSTGMSGAITPVAILKPVRLAMTNVQRCSLHNWDILEYLGLHKGCHVTVRKAGEIIPEIVRCVETGATKEDYSILTTKYPDDVPPKYASTHENTGMDFYNRPKLCPFCMTHLQNERNSDGRRLVAWVCTNPRCRAQIAGKLVNFCSREVMNIRGMGESTIQSLVDAGKLKTFHDIYDLTVEDFIGIGNIREKRAKQLVAAIQKSKGNYLHQLIEGFSIPDVGHQASPIIAKVYRNLENLADASTHKTPEHAQGLQLNGLGVNVSNAFANWMMDNSAELQEMLKRGVAMEAKAVEMLSNKLAGRVCIMTGVFDDLEREDFKALVVKHGGTICSSITKKTNLVLVGNGAGPSKLTKIKQLQATGQQMDVYTPETLDKFMEMLK